MTITERPKLRPLSGRPVRHQGETFVVLEDPTGVCEAPVLVPIEGFRHVVCHFDGETTLRQIQDRLAREQGVHIASADLEQMVRRLDEALMLDGPRFAQFQADYHRDPLHRSVLAGPSYPADPDVLRRQLDGYFADLLPTGPPSGRLRGLLAPHIDFGRGGPVYARAYHDLLAHCDAETVVILGVSHRYPCRRRFAATRKAFETPLGTVAADGEFLDAIEQSFGEDLYADELAHRGEWSIEFQAVWLQHVWGSTRPFRIVPILVGSFYDLMEEGRDPIGDDDVRAMVGALRAAEAQTGRKVLYLGSVDFAHFGPEFDDPEPIDAAMRGEVERYDAGLIEHATGNDPRGWFAQATDSSDRWRTCGLAATYTMLHAMGPAPGRLLSYHQAVDAGRTCGVSLAAVAFDRP